MRALAAAWLLACAAPEDVQSLGPVPLVSELQHYTVTVTPEQEILRGLNAFTTERAIPEGTTVTRGEALMPAHGHASSAAIIRTEGAKTYIERIDLNMPGRWEITLSLSGARGSDALRFAVEVP
jgi:hypothetical protein